MGNDVRIRVHWEDPDGRKFQQAQTAKARKAGAAAGDEFAKTTREKVRKAGSDAADEFEGSFSGKLTKTSIAAAQKAGQEAAKSFSGSFSGQLGPDVVPVAEKVGKDSGDAFGDKLIAASKRGTTKATSAIERELNSAQAKIAAVGEQIGDAAGHGIEEGVKGGARRGGQAVDGEMSRVASRANKVFDVKLFSGLSVGLPAAAAIGAVGAATALALPGAAVVGVSALILRNNEKVQGAFNDLSNNVIADSEKMAGVMAGPLAGAAGQLQVSWDRLRPLAQSAFRATVPEVETLTGAVTDLAEGAMPGLVTGLKASHPALLGVRVLSGEAGKGLSEFFANASQGSAGAGQGMTIFAGTLRMVEARAGTLFANLANGSSGPLMQLHVVLDQTTGALLDLTSHGSAAIGFFTGFGSAAGGTIATLHGVLTILNALPEGVGQFGGAMTAAAMIGNKFGLDLGAQFTGIKDKVKAAGNELSGIDKFAAKAGTAVGALGAAAISPTTLAVAGLATGLMILGQQHQDAAADASAQAARERDLAAALRESKGAITESVRAKAADKLQNFVLHDGTRNLLADTQKLAGPQGVQLLTDGYLGNTDAAKKLSTQLRQTVDEHSHLAKLDDYLGPVNRLRTGAGGLMLAMDDTGFAAKQLADIIDSSSGEFANAAKSNEAYGIAAQGGVKPMNALEAATEGLRDAASGSEERLSALVDVLNILEGRNASFEESIQSGNDALRTMEQNLKKGIDKADGFGKALLNADGSVNTFTANGSQLQDLATGLQSSFAKAGGSIDEMVRKGMPFDQAVKKVNDGLATQRDRFVSIAEKMGLTKQEAQGLADKYGLMPQEITTRITADTKQAQDAINALPDIAAATKGAVPISADTNKATGQINTTVQYADGSTGVITLDGNKDPVTGKIMVAVQYANGQHTYMTIDAFNQAARDRTLEAKRNADGTVAYIIVGADTRPAENEVQGFVNRRYVATVYVQTKMSGVNPVSLTGPRRAVAGGGFVGNAPLRKFAGGGIMDIRPGGLLSGPGTGTSDSILALSATGPAGVSTGEYVEPANRVTPRTLPILEAIRQGTFKGFASGGLIQAEDGSWVPSSFYGPAPKGPHPMLTEQGYAKLRAQATASGIGSLPQILQDQLRTYGGWVDAPPASAPSSSAPRSSSGYRGRSGGGTVTLEVVSSGNALDELLAQLIRKYVRVRGGNVQTVFGRG
ncbi:hypothetical protein GCM10027258_62280 [Amycolatopsis stemonae]